MHHANMEKWYVIFFFNIDNVSTKRMLRSGTANGDLGTVQIQ